MSLFQKSNNQLLWNSIRRVHNNLSNQKTGKSCGIINIIRTDYYSQNIQPNSEIQDNIKNIKEKDFKKEKDIQNEGEFYKKGKMSYWCDN